MKVQKKTAIIGTVALVAALGAGGVTAAYAATSSPDGHHQKAEKSDGDGEVPDSTEKAEKSDGDGEVPDAIENEKSDGDGEVADSTEK